MKVGMKRPSPAIVISVIAVIVTLTGTAYAALAPHSVSSRQLKPRAVTNAKFAESAVTGPQVAKTTLDGKDFNLSNFETVPAATSAGSAANSTLVTGHPAACPGGTILIRGSCYDSAPLGPVLGVKAAAEACAARGGFLPSPAEALSLRGAISLGDGTGTNSVFTDSYLQRHERRQRRRRRSSTTPVRNTSGWKTKAKKKSPYSITSAPTGWSTSGPPDETGPLGARSFAPMCGCSGAAGVRHPVPQVHLLEHLGDVEEAADTDDRCRRRRSPCRCRIRLRSRSCRTDRPCPS